MKKSKKIRVVAMHGDGLVSVEYVGKDSAFKDIKTLIDCDILEMHVVRIGGRYFYVCCDDEGRLKEGNKPVAYSKRYGLFVGSIVLSHFEDSASDEWYTIEDEDLSILEAHMKIGVSGSGRIVVLLNDDEVI